MVLKSKHCYQRNC